MQHRYGADHDLIGDEADMASRPLMRIASVTVLIVLVAAVAVWGWRLGTRDAAAVPVIRAMEGPARVAPEDPGGVTAAHQGLELNSILEGTPGLPDLDSAALRPAEPVLTDEDAPQGALPAFTRVETTSGIDEAEALAVLPMPMEEPEPGAETRAALPEEPAPRAERDEAAAAVAEVVEQRPRARPAGLVVARSEPARTASLPPATASDARPAAPQPATGGRMVQLGAFDSEIIARQRWDQLQRAHADILGNKSLYVERTTNNARVFYRLRVVGFGTADEQRGACERLRERGVDCIPVQAN